MNEKKNIETTKKHLKQVFVRENYMIDKRRIYNI